MKKAKQMAKTESHKEMLEALGEFGIKIMTEIANRIYSTRKVMRTNVECNKHHDSSDKNISKGLCQQNNK